MLFPAHLHDDSLDLLPWRSVNSRIRKAFVCVVDVRFCDWLTARILPPRTEPKVMEALLLMYTDTVMLALGLPRRDGGEL